MVETSVIPVEAEATLLICSKHPRSVAREIAGLANLATFRVIGEGCRVLNDTYLDTQRLDLKRQHWILRLRKADSTWWITLKGPSRETLGGVMERLELEIPWTFDSLVQVMNKLDIQPVSLEARNTPTADPVSTMIDIGMVVIQHRVTEREVRNVLLNDQPVIIAEIAVDRVKYDLPGGVIFHHEVEIESKLGEYRSAINEIADDLLKRCAPRLRIWKFGKLSTGQAIDALFRRNALNGLVNNDGSLQPEAYDLVESFLRPVSISGITATEEGED